jgi:hypothetical protein
MDTGALIHHVLGLDEGYFVRRNRLLNMEDPEDVEFYLRNEVEVVEEMGRDLIDEVPTQANDDSESN